MTLFTVSAILVVDTLTASAAIGDEDDRLVDPRDRLLPDPLRADHRRARDHLPDAGRHLRVGQARLRQPLGRAHHLLVLGQRRAVDALGVPAVRRRLLPAVRSRLDRMARGQVAAGDHGHRSHLAGRRGRRDAPRGRQVGQQRRRDPQGRRSSSRWGSAASSSRSATAPRTRSTSRASCRPSGSPRPSCR